MEYQDTSFDTIFRDTAQGKFDVAVAASTITEGRERTVDFSDPYYRANQALTVPKGSDIQTSDDLGGTTVGAQDATTGEDYVQDETDASEVRGFPEGPDALNALRTGAGRCRGHRRAGRRGRGEEVRRPRDHADPDRRAVRLRVRAGQRRPARGRERGALATMKDDGTIDELYEKYVPDQAALGGPGGHARAQLDEQHPGAGGEE